MDKQALIDFCDKYVLCSDKNQRILLSKMLSKDPVEREQILRDLDEILQDRDIETLKKQDTITATLYDEQGNVIEVPANSAFVAFKNGYHQFIDDKDNFNAQFVYTPPSKTLENKE